MLNSGKKFSSPVNLFPRLFGVKWLFLAALFFGSLTAPLLSQTKNPDPRKVEAGRATAAAQAAPRAPTNADPGYIDPTVSRRSEPGYGWLLLRTIFVLALFGGAAALIWRWLKNRKPMGRQEEGPIRILHDYPLAIAKSLKVVEVGKEVFLLSMTQDQIALIARLEDKETIDQFRLEASRVKSGGNASFGELLLKVLPGMGAKAPKEPLDITRNLREKLRRMK
ncbi:MAG: flagellar biosynthetic protein FliO [Spirochaetes bacterium]|nr:flagellar biosynthetic protein FliO [Spirochaetota bacterium]